MVVCGGAAACAAARGSLFLEAAQESGAELSKATHGSMAVGWIGSS